MRALPVVAVAAIVVLAACDADGAVDLTFRPAPSAELHYETQVESTETTDVPCEPPNIESEHATLETTQRVLESGDDGVRVEVTLSRPGVGQRTVVVRFDRAAQLTAVEQVEGIPAAALGELGLSEVFPPAAGAPPDHPLAPGDRWVIDDEVRLDSEAPATQLQGHGRLVALGVEDGHDTATIESSTTLPVSTTAADASGSRSLDGEQTTEVRATYDVDDGTILHAESVTTGTFDLVLGPPPGGAGEPCAGTLIVEVRSAVSRRE